MTATVCAATQYNGKFQSAAILAGCVVILTALLGYKILDPGITSSWMIDRFIPLGLSYYSLRCIHVLMERYLARIEQPSVLQLVRYLFFPATIVAGPIHRYADFVAERAADFQWAKFSMGLERILYGYVKIIVLSNYLLSEKLFPWARSFAEPSSALYQYLEALDYGITLYLQFSGYSDVAIGFALLLGYKVIENFSWPYLKMNIVEFWRSWHISLTRLCREYVFTSVHASTRQAWLGVLATMLAISLWHGITLNYLAWGVYHAAGLVFYRLWSGSVFADNIRSALPATVTNFLAWAITFQFVILGFIWTKEASFAASVEAWLVLSRGVFGSV